MNPDDAGRKAKMIVHLLVGHGLFTDWKKAEIQRICYEVKEIILDEEQFVLAALEVAQPNDWPKDYQEQFWSSYPRRIGKDAALRELDKIHKTGKVPFAKILDAVYIYRHETQSTDMKYIAHPERWLKKGRWKDDPNAIAGRATDGRGEVKNGFIGRLIG